MLYDSPVTGTPRARRRRLPVVLAIALVCAGLLAFGAVQSFGNHVPPACTSNNQQGTLCVTVTDTPDPVAYSSFDGNSTFILYHVELSNTGRSNLSHVGLEDTIPTGTGFFRVTSSQGTCSHSGPTVTCALGAVSKGKTATVDIVVTAPTTSDSNPPNITITNVAEGSFDENFNDNPNGGKQDTVTYSEPTTVSKTAGSTFVPAGQTGNVGTDPGATQQGSATLPQVANDVIASLNLLPPDAFCVDGQFKPPGSNKTYVCRNGAFVSASVLNAANGSHYTNAQRPLVFHLRWDASLISSKQTVKNFVVFYVPDGSSQVQVISAQCNAGATNLPCIRNVNENKTDGSWSVDLVRPDNGHMR